MVYINMGKSYEGYNRALGKRIRSKRHYHEEMRRQGCIPQAEADAIRKKKTEKAPYTASRKVHEIVEACGRPDKNGNVKMPDRAVDELKNMGVSFDKDKNEKVIREANNA